MTDYGTIWHTKVNFASRMRKFGEEMPLLSIKKWSPGEDHAEGGVREHFAEQKRKAIVKTSSGNGRADIKNKNSVKFI